MFRPGNYNITLLLDHTPMCCRARLQPQYRRSYMTYGTAVYCVWYWKKFTYNYIASSTTYTYRLRISNGFVTGTDVLLLRYNLSTIVQIYNNINNRYNKSNTCISGSSRFSGPSTSHLATNSTRLYGSSLRSQITVVGKSRGCTPSPLRSLN